MRFAIETLGTRGDVQPYIALARGLMARGHEVQLAAPVQFTDMAAVHKVPFVGLPGEFLALLDTPEGKAAVAGGDGFHAGFKLLKHVRPLVRAFSTRSGGRSAAFSPTYWSIIQNRSARRTWPRRSVCHMSWLPPFRDLRRPVNFQVPCFRLRRSDRSTE
ncbi:glycosyltransferase [Neorhizobium tomejilense]|uniref:glycosyltransferase n=1 Tax=Neorhizobium tomejilense TaxID=2093828 RepID=UPI00315A432F